MERTRLVVLALLVLACGERSDDGPRPEQTAQHQQPEVREVPVQPPPAPRPTLDSAARQRLRTALREGRTATRAGRHEEALTRMEEALAIDATSRRLRCEVGYVAFLAGERERASTLIMQALSGMQAGESAPPAMRSQYAMCLYNAGLVYEAAGRTDKARSAWLRSLSLRPNATVERRLAALTAVATAPPSLRLDPSASFETLGRALGDFYCRNGETNLHAENCADIQVNLQAPSGTGSGLEARLVTLSANEADVFVVLVRSAARVAAFQIHEMYNPGVAGIWNDCEISRTELVDALQGGAVELRIDIRDGGVDLDMAGCLGTSEARWRTILCTADGGLRCAQIVTGEEAASWCDAECVRQFEEDPQEVCQGQSGSEAAPNTVRYRLNLALASGQANLSVSETHGREPPSGIVGTHPITTILTEGAIEPIPTAPQ